MLLALAAITASAYDDRHGNTQPMGSKFVIYFCAFVGSTVGGYVPALWHQGIFSAWSIILGGVGGLFGVYVGFKINQNIGG